jgi:hypothetical protein
MPDPTAPEAPRCAECDCANGGHECNWIGTSITPEALDAAYLRGVEHGREAAVIQVWLERPALAEALAALSWAKANLKALSAQCGHEAAQFPMIDRALASVNAALGTQLIAKEIRRE